MPDSDFLRNFREIEVETTTDKIVRQIHSLITSGQLKPGDRLPPERKLAEKLGVGRTSVRDAIRKLEFYGILKTHAQSGTIVAGTGIAALEGVISDVLKIENSDFSALVETRVLLETHAAALAAQRRTTDDIVKIQNALDAYARKVEIGDQGVEEDLMYHLKIAEASKNPVLKSLMLIITPDIVKSFIELDVCKDGRFNKSLEEHQVILNHITNQDAALAAQAMKDHLKDVVDYSNSWKNEPE